MTERADLVGMVVDEFTFRVEAGKVREFARAIKDPAARYDDPAAAAAEGFAASPAPLTFSVVAGHHRDAAAAVRRLGLDIERVVVGEVEWRYPRPIVAGDLLAGRRVVEGVRVREGDRGGTMTLVTLVTEFRDPDGALALEQRETLIETARGGS